VGKSGLLEHKLKSSNISETRTDRGKVTMGAYRNSPTLFRMVPSPTPYGLPFHMIGGSQPPPRTSIAILSQERAKLYTDVKFGRYILSGSIQTKAR